MDTTTLTTRLITDTTTKIDTCNSIEYPTQQRKGIADRYSILGLIVSIETTKLRGWNKYDTEIRIAYSHHWGIPDGFSEWLQAYKTSLGFNSRLIINSTSIENHSATRLQNTHDIGVIAGESYVLTIINKYIELLFNSVNKEVITRQIDELQSELATL